MNHLGILHEPALTYSHEAAAMNLIAESQIG